ncbi:MAG: hypothetical protein DYG96_10320, partial [Chlorobi bacterium CHB2]|nr:hypothetical protein [Chlorobi bacterium CHB2]
TLRAAITHFRHPEREHRFGRDRDLGGHSCGGLQAVGLVRRCIGNGSPNIPGHERQQDRGKKLPEAVHLHQNVTGVPLAQEEGKR